MADHTTREKPSLGRLVPRHERRTAPAVSELVSTSEITPGETLPLVVRPAVPDLDSSSWVQANTEWIGRRVIEHGGVLLRDFGLEGPADFEEIARLIAPSLVDYVEGSSPRIMVTNKVYTSTEYPPEFFVSMHSELSYAHRWPSKIFFFCDVEPEVGGATPIADNRKVLEALSPGIREKFMVRGVRYTRNVHGGQGAGLSWQTVFETDDRSTVEQYCEEGGIDYRWTEDGGLRTSQTRPAAIRHPVTKDLLWFNQVDQWHPSNLDPEVAEALLATVGEENLPINAYFGDGSPLDPADLDEVRDVYRRILVHFPWRKGDLLILDNMLVAHGRMPYSGKRRVVVTMGDPVAIEDVEAIPG